MTTLSCTMRRALLPALLTLFAAAGPALAASAPPFRMPVPALRTLPNGLRVAVFVDRRVPLVEIHLLVPGGVAQEPAASPGAASAAAQLLRAGTSSRTADELASEVSRLGGSLSALAGRDYSSVDGMFLSTDLEEGLELLADEVVNPIFPPEEIERYRPLTASMLAQFAQDPTSQAEESLWGLVFGSHPYGRPVWGTIESLPGLDREGVQTFHRDYYRPDRAILVIAGDVDPEKVFALATDRCGNWAGHAARPEGPAVPVPGPVRVRVLDRPGQAQSVIRIGLLAPGRQSPDAPALQIANYILGGGGFSSRLAELLRVKGGLSYDARSSYTILRDAGLVTLATVGRNDSVAIIVRHMRDELARMASEPPDPAEVAAACHSFQAGYPLQFQSPGALISQWAALDFHGVTPDSLDRYVQGLAAISPQQVQDVARRWLDPAHMEVVVAGPADVLEQPLSELGPVEIVRPGAAAERMAAPEPSPSTPEQQARGRELVEQAVVAHGGLERLRRVKDSTVNAEMMMPLNGVDVTLRLELVRQEPMRMRYTTRLSTAENGQILDGDHGWLYGIVFDSLRVTEADSVNMAAMKLAFKSDVVHLLLGAIDSSASLVWRGHSTSGERETDQVEVIPLPGHENERRLLTLDSETHRLVADDFGPSMTKAGVWNARGQFRDYRTVQGVVWPFYEDRTVAGVHTMTILVRSVAFNTGVSPKVFAKPQAQKAPAVHH